MENEEGLIFRVQREIRLLENQEFFVILWKSSVLPTELKVNPRVIEVIDSRDPGPFPSRFQIGMESCLISSEKERYCVFWEISALPTGSMLERRR